MPSNEPISEPAPVGELPPQGIRKPSPTDFKLPVHFNWAHSKARIEAQSKRITWLAWTFALVPAVPLGLSSVDWTGPAFGDHAILMSIVFFAVVWSIVFVPAFALSNSLLDGKRIADAKAYGTALETWEYNCLETGVGFWVDQRGVPFERALERLFRTRGCQVSMTKATGDGGVDLKLSTTRSRYWCQCKGQQKPVGVKPVREIAGVCSRNDNLPVVFAVNGYTRPAQEAAQELGVLLYDVADIVRMAALSRIDKL